MDQISKDIAIKFCKQCEWAYETWITHKILFDDNKKPERNIEKLRFFTSRLSIITQEYCLQQIAKLHDPAKLGNSFNLSIDYMIQFGGWGEEEEDIKNIRKKLNGLWNILRPARNKLLAHNDLKTLKNGEALGAFPDRADEKYFEALQELVNKVSEKWTGGPHSFGNFAKVDAKEFLDWLECTDKVVT